jgi:hypothetical protein
MGATDVIAVCAAVIALASLFVAANQAYLARKHNRLSVRPILSVYRKQFSEQPIEYCVENRGLGPAIVKSFSILIDGNEVKASDGNCVYAATDTLGVDRSDVGGHLIPVNEVITAGQEIVAIRFPRAGSDATFHKELLGKLPRMKFLIRYESMYEERYIYDGNG